MTVGTADRESFDVRSALDQRCQSVVNLLGEAGFFADRPPRFSADAYHALVERVDRAFDVPQTSITTAAARLLFAVAESCRPRTIAVFGSYHGNSLVWLAGPALTGEAPDLARIDGYDIDAAAVAGAARNMARLDPNAPVRFHHADAFSVARSDGHPIDLLLIDIDGPNGRKSGYAALLETALPRLAPGALILAHDRCEATFAQDFAPYLALVGDRTRFAESTAIPIDDSGFELTLAL